MKSIQYWLLDFRQNDEVSVDGTVDVHAAAYQRINHSIPMYTTYMEYIVKCC